MAAQTHVKMHDGWIKLNHCYLKHLYVCIENHTSQNSSLVRLSV
jgi:hypothetical protein